MPRYTAGAASMASNLYATPAEYRRALTVLEQTGKGIHPTHRKLLEAHLALADRPITWRQLGTSLGYPESEAPSTVNRLYGPFAARLGRELRLRSQPPFKLHLIAKWAGKDSRGEQAFLMRPEVVVALKELGWVASPPPRRTPSNPSTEDDPLEDIKAAETELAAVSDTERRALVQARIGQGPFRDKLMKGWGACAVTGVSERSVLRASHIKPWRESSNEERLDRYNGLLLVANLDALFDAGLITFADSGVLLCSKQLPRVSRDRLGIKKDARLQKISRRHQHYLDYHRRFVFQDNAAAPTVRSGEAAGRSSEPKAIEQV